MLCFEPEYVGGPTRVMTDFGMPTHSVDIYGNVRNDITGTYYRTYFFKGAVQAMLTCNGINRWYDVDLVVAKLWWDLSLEELKNTIPEIYPSTLKRLKLAKEFYTIPLNDRKNIAELGIKGYPANNPDTFDVVTRRGDIWNSKFLRKADSKGDKYGYREVFFSKGDGSTPLIMSVHRLVALAFVEIPKEYQYLGLTADDLCVHHIDNNQRNNRWDNLKWVTVEEHQTYHRKRPRIGGSK